MNYEEKQIAVKEISEQLNSSNGFYLADVSELTVNQTTELRKLCHEKGISLRVSKNTLIRKAFKNVNIDNEELIEALKGPSSLMLSDVINGPAKLIKEFRKKYDKPVLKAAYIDEIVYIGDSELDTLVNLKSKEELVADVVVLLNSPIKNLIGALNSSAGKITGVLKTLSNKEDK